MKKENLLFTIFIATILVIRAWVFLFPQRKLIIFGASIHHFWIGLILVLLVILFPMLFSKFKTMFFSVGLGIAVDELTFILLGYSTVKDYWSIYSVFGVIMMTAIVFTARKNLASKL